MGAFDLNISTIFLAHYRAEKAKIPPPGQDESPLAYSQHLEQAMATALGKTIGTLRAIGVGAAPIVGADGLPGAVLTPSGF